MRMLDDTGDRGDEQQYVAKKSDASADADGLVAAPFRIRDVATE